MYDIMYQVRWSDEEMDLKIVDLRLMMNGENRGFVGHDFVI